MLKKIIVLVNVLLFTVLISGCDSFKPRSEDNQAPVITGPGAITLDYGSSEPNWKSYITAEDFEDGAIDITDEMINSLDVDFFEEGVYEVHYIIEDLDGETSTYILEVQIIDIRTYTLFVLGNQEMDIEVNTEFIDPGVTALLKGGEVTRFITEGIVDMNTVGTYTLIYSIEGYENTVTRTINVIDTIAPRAIVSEVKIKMPSEPIDWTLYPFDFTDNYSEDVLIEVIEDTVNYETVGNYNVTLRVYDEFNNSTNVTFNVSISERVNAVAYDLRNLAAIEKAKIYAALEEYLLDSISGGVPLYRAAKFEIFSDRVNLFSPVYNGVLEFGVEFSELLQDDSSVYMYDDVFGNPGEYTYRTAYDIDPTNLNPWTEYDSNSNIFMNQFTGKLYDFYFDDSLSGYELNPSLASGEPLAVEPTVINGKTYSTIWQIPVRDDLIWSFHSNTDTSTFASGYEELDASDWLWTFEHALSESWFRAVSGGGDFITKGVVGAADYAGGLNNWADVGLRMANGETNVIEVEFMTEKSMYDVKYMFSDTSLSVLNEELFTSVGEAGYGISPETVASSGVYTLDEWTTGQYLTFVKNSNHPDSLMYHYTGYQYRFMDDSDTFIEFLAGRLDGAFVPTPLASMYAQDPRVSAIPNSLWTLAINGFGTVENRDAYIEQYPEFELNETWVPEPILMYPKMKQALYFGVDRYEAAVNISKIYLPAYTMIIPTHFIDNESGISIRGTEEGSAILDNYFMDSYGYSPSTAYALFKSAIEQAIEDGFYEVGTATNYTEIELELYITTMENLPSQQFVAELVRQYEELFVDDENFIKIIININDVSFPSSYTENMMVANMDLGIGGISSGIITAPGIFEIYTDDNNTGFTFNWGIDTHTPNIEVTYTNLVGIEVTEVWSYNAMVAALNGEVYILDGIEQIAMINADDLIDAYLNIDNEVLVSSTEETQIAEIMLGDTLENIALENGFDNLISKIVVTESGKSTLYLILVDNTGYKLYDKYDLSATAEDAIIQYTGWPNYYISSVLLDDNGVATDQYLIDTYPECTTIIEVATKEGSPIEFTEVYSVEWSAWTDVLVVLHIGDYYIGWSWL